MNLDCRCQNEHCGNITKVGAYRFGNLEVCQACYELLVWRRDRDDRLRAQQSKSKDE